MALLTASHRLAVIPTNHPVQLRVTFYTRTLCCCCQTAREVLADYVERYPGLVVEEIDATELGIEALIGPTVPVVAIDGRIRFRGEVNRVLMDRLVAARMTQG